MSDIEKIRADFPILSVKVNGNPLVYFDNAATTQKPRQVIDAISYYYSNFNANVHRGVHKLSQQATDAFEIVRKQIATFINAQSPTEIIYTRGTTEAINLVAFSFFETFIKEGDEIIVSALDHHSNLVPWQMACTRKKAVLKVIPVTIVGELDMQAFQKLLTPNTRLVAVSHVSNTLGTINPVKEIVKLAHANNTAVFVDGAQGMSHGKVDVQDIGCDFYAFSGHKMYAPMGIGCLYGKTEWLEKMNPYQYGGEMIQKVSFECTTFNELPYKFEAGTPNVADVVGLGAALKYIEHLGWEFIEKQETQLLNYLMEKLSKINGIQFIGTSKNKAAIVSFNIEGIHYFDAGTILDHMGIAVRTGSHCTQPLMDVFHIEGTIRASMAFYNTVEEIDKLIKGVEKVKQLFG